MKVTVEFSVDNAAFEDNGYVEESGAVLRRAAAIVESGSLGALEGCGGAKLFDSYGNSIGWVRVVGDGEGSKR